MSSTDTHDTAAVVQRLVDGDAGRLHRCKLRARAPSSALACSSLSVHSQSRARTGKIQPGFARHDAGIGEQQKQFIRIFHVYVVAR